MTNFYVTQDAKKADKANYFYTSADSKRADIAINSAIKAAGAVATSANPATVFVERGTYYISDHIWFTPNSNPKRSGGVQVAPAYPCSYVTLRGIDKPVIKISGGLNPKLWGGSNTYDRLGMIFMYGASNVTLSGLTLDGSYADLYEGKSTFTYGQSIMDAVVQYSCKNIKAEDIIIYNGACDGFLVATSDGFTAEGCVVNYCGHDGFQCYNTKNVLVNRCMVGMRSNCGFRWAGASSNGEVRNSEFWTALGGAAAFELQNTASNLKIHHNYIHDVNGNGYGGIGYKGQSPTGTGHQYYNNIIVDCAYGISDNIPNTAVIKNNVILNCSLTSRGVKSNNVTTTSGYTFVKSGVKKSCDTYWIVTGGNLSKELVGIEPKTVPGSVNTLQYSILTDATGTSIAILIGSATPELTAKIEAALKSVVL